MSNKLLTSSLLVRIIHYLFYLLIFLTPLLMSSRTTEMFEFNKMIFIYCITIVSAAIWIIHYILHRPKLYLPLLLKMLIVFVTVLSISAFYSIDTHTSIFGYYGRWNGGLFSIVSYILLFFVFIQTFTVDYIKNLLKVSLLSSVMVILWGIPAKLGGDLSCLLFTGTLTNACWTAQFQPAVRMFSTLGQPNWLGAYLAVHFFIGVYFFLSSFVQQHDSIWSVAGLKERIFKLIQLVINEKKSNLMTYLYGCYLILNVVGLFFTRSRSSLLAVGVSMAIGIVLLITDNAKRNLKILYRTVLITALLVTTYCIVAFSSANLPDNTPEHLQITDSFQIRKIVWQGAIDLGVRYPLFGSGPETFAYAYYFVRPEGHNLTSEWDFIYNKAHNEYLNYLATTGFIGFIAYIILISVSLRSFASFLNSRQIDKSLFTFSLLLAYLTILITNFFGFSTTNIQLFFYLLPGMAYLTFQPEKREMQKREFSTIRIVQIVITVAACLYLLEYVLSYYQADRLYKRAQEAESQEDYVTASQLYIQALGNKYEHVYEDKLSTSLAHLAFINSFNSEGQNTEELISLSRESNNNALKKSPDNIHYWRTKAKNNYVYYQMTGDIDDLKRALDSMRYTTVLAPTDAQSYYMLGLFYSLMAQESESSEYQEKATDAVEYALELRPNFIEAQELLQQIKSN